MNIKNLKQTTSSGTIGNDQLRSALYMAENRTLVEASWALIEKAKVSRVGILSHQKKVGKSYLTALLSLGFANLLGKKVLLVDCSSLFPNFEQNNRLNLLTALDPKLESLKGTPLSQTKWEEIQPNLTLLPLNHLLTLSSQHHASVDVEFKQDSVSSALELIKAASASYDITLFNTVAFEQLNRQNINPFTVARYFEAAFLVTPSSAIQQSALSEIVAQITTHHINLLGVIPNQGSSV